MESHSLQLLDQDPGLCISKGGSFVDRDSTYYPDAAVDADEGSYFYFMPIRIFLFDANAEPVPDPTFHPDEDPDPNPIFQIKA
jgi:hypothetical protein